jgi:hypothetical protein
MAKFEEIFHPKATGANIGVVRAKLGVSQAFPPHHLRTPFLFETGGGLNDPERFLWLSPDVVSLERLTGKVVRQWLYEVRGTRALKRDDAVVVVRRAEDGVYGWVGRLVDQRTAERIRVMRPDLYQAETFDG